MEKNKIFKSHHFPHAKKKFNHFISNKVNSQRQEKRFDAKDQLVADHRVTHTCSGCDYDRLVCIPAGRNPAL